jgi:acyl-CoA synthetase (AMP-forming)/AMP-acid ligase II
MYTFAQPLGRALSIAAGSPAVVCQDRRRTYAELGSRCRRLAGAMRALGLARGDRVGVVALNSDRYLELYLGLPAAGYVLVPVNSRLAAAEMRAILDDAEVSADGRRTGRALPRADRRVQGAQVHRVAHRAAAQVGGRQDPQAGAARTALGRSAGTGIRRLARCAAR